MKKQLLIAVTLILSITTTFAADIRIIKNTPNIPTLYLNTSTNSTAAKSIGSLLQFYNYAKLTSNKKADYTLRVLAQTKTSMSMLLQPRGGAAVTVRRDFRDGQLPYRRSADAIIRKISGAPGICASKIAFVSDRTRYKELFLGTPDRMDKSAEKLTNNRRISVEPNWSPTGRYLLYTLYERNSTNVVLLDRLKKSQRRISGFRGMNAGATFSTDGKEIALLLSKDGKVEIYRMRLNPLKLTRVTNNFAEEGSLCWSPKNNLILGVANFNRIPNLYLFDPIRGSHKRLYKSYSECVSPDWSKVSNKICFITKGKIGIIDMNSSRPKVKFLETKGSWEEPSWAPDGRHLVCVNKYGKKRTLWMIDTKTGISKQLQKQAVGNSTLPAWSPLL